MKKLTNIGSKGDTIIEILLSIAVLSLVLSVSYGLANRSSQSIRQAQERGEAQKLAEEQLELLRGYITPDQLWESNQCFKADNPSTPVNESDEPTSDNNNCQNRGSGSRYNLRIGIPADNTYTVYVNWPNVKGGTDELTLSYKIPATGDILATPHRQCSNDIDDGPDGVKDEDDPNCHTDGNAGNPDSYDPTINNEDPPPACSDGTDNDDDTLVDYPDDPGCTDADDDNEYNPPPPPFVWDSEGWATSFTCVPDRTLYNPFGDGNDGCLRTGSDMYAYRNINAVYSGIPNGLKRGNAILKICYQNYGNDQPTGFTNYRLKATIGHGTTQEISLPFRTTNGCSEVNMNVEEVNSSSLRLIWFNDAWVGGDANLRINDIHIVQQADEGTTPPNQAIDGEDYTSCESSGTAYCIRSDELYSNSVYALSSAAANPAFVTKYKFNSSITPGNYDLSITYFNGDYDTLPAPPGSYKYNVTVSYPGGSRTVDMPIENNLQSRHIRQSHSLNNISITSGSPTITIRWNNDYYSPGVFDANFGINSVLLTRR